MSQSYCKQCKGHTDNDDMVNQYNSRIIVCLECGYLKKPGWVPDYQDPEFQMKTRGEVWPRV